MVLPRLGLIVLVCASGLAGGEPPRPAAPLADTVFLQEVPQLITTKQPLTSVAWYHNQLFLGHREGLEVLKQDVPESLSDGPRFGIFRLKVLAGSLWAVAADGLWRFDGDHWVCLGEQVVNDICLHQGRLLVAGAGLSVVEGDQLRPLRIASPGKPLPQLRGVASCAGTVYVHDGRQLFALEAEHLSAETVADWGQLPPDVVIRDLLPRDNRLLVATNQGLAILRGMTWYWLRGRDGLCYEDTTCLMPGGDEELWIGTSQGLIHQMDGQFRYYAGPRWLRQDKVSAVTGDDHVVYVATDGGLAILRLEPYTLAKKAVWYEQWLARWGQKRLGFTHTLVGRAGIWLRDLDSSTIQQSAAYLASRCYQFAVTGDATVRVEAVDLMKSLKWSQEITGREGLFAQSIATVEELSDHLLQPMPASTWHRTADGQWQWQGEPSDADLITQVYATTLFLDLVANAEERVWATEHLHRLIDPLVRNGWMLRNLDGQPIPGGRWDPEYLRSPQGLPERGRRALEAFALIATAAHFTGDSQYCDARQQLIAWDYLSSIVHQKETFPAERFRSEGDQLAYMAYYSLLRHETDPELRRLWQRSLERSWEIKRLEGVPWFHFLYGALTGEDNESARAIEHLRAWPLDLRVYPCTNSHRSDLYTPEGYRSYGPQIRPFSPREIGPQPTRGDVLTPDRPQPPESTVANPSDWLEAYWMARYFGYLAAPTTEDPQALTVAGPGLPEGAAPYQGPARSKLRHEQP